MIPVRAPVARAAPAAWLAGHPPGLVIVMLTGMWEVFALAGMRAVLVFYLTQSLSFDPASAVQVYALSTAAAMAMSLVGAIVADRLIGVQRAVVYGAVGMALGHFLLVVPALVFVALGIIVVANGLFKPSLVSQMNRLYDPDDPHRVRAFTLYKAGCNAAAIFAPIVIGLVGQMYGWPLALALCGAGMLVACVAFLAGRSYLVESPAALVVRDPQSVAGGTGKPALLTLVVVLFASALFWTAHGQQGGTIALWAQSDVIRSVAVFGRSFEIPAAWFQSVNPVIIVCATPLLNWWWTRKASLGHGSDELRKMCLGAVLLVVSMLIIAVAARLNAGHLVPSAWLFAALLFLTFGELHFDALGQAFVLRAASPANMTLFVSLWFVTIAAGFAGAGWLGQAWGHVSISWYFLSAAAVAAVAAVLIRSASSKCS